MWALPTWKQFKKWSLPSKYTFVGFVAGSMLSGGSVYYSVRPNPQLVVLEKALRAEKPTKLIVKSVALGNYLGLEQKLVFAEIDNLSARPAYRLQISLLGPTSAIARPTDRSLEIFTSSNLEIPAQDSLRLPIAYEADVLSALKVRCISGFSLNLNAREQNATFIPISLEYRYTTVFKEEISSMTGVWAIVPVSCR